MLPEKNAKILLLITNLGQGGAQRVFHDHSKFLSERFGVTEAVFHKDESPDLYVSGNPALSLDVSGGGNPFNKIRNFFRRCLRLRSEIRKNQFGVCISHMDGANWVNVLSFSRARKILVVHGTLLHDANQKRWMQWLRRKIIIPFVYNRAALTVAVSEGIRYELEHFYKVKRVLAIPNFFDIDAIKTQAQEPLPAAWENLFSSYPVLITSGRFHEQKKQRFLLPVLKNLKKKNSAVKLVILGDGPLRESLLDTALNLGLSTYAGWNKSQPFSENYDVYFTGYVTNPFSYLRRSRLFLFPSGWEGFPMALCEAMISGVTVLSADCPTGPRQILSPGSFDPYYQLKTAEQTPCGWLMPVTDKESFEAEWTRTILSMLDDDKLRETMSTNAEEHMENYRKENIIKTWNTIINNLIAVPK